MIPGENHGASRRAVVAALVTVQVFFGLHYTAAKYILTFLPPRAWAIMRIAPAAVLLMAYMVAARRDKLPRDRRDLAALAFFSIFGVVINQVLFVEGLSRTATSHSAIINTSIPVATLLIAILMRRERATGRKLAGIVLSLAGVLYLIGHSGASLGGQIAVGDMLTLVNALSYSFFLVISKPILSRHSSLGVTTWLLTFGAVGISVVGAPQLATVDYAAVPTGVWWAAAFVILFPTLGAYMLNSWALKRVESSVVALFIYLQPLIASVLGVVWLGESLGAGTIFSAALIFTGVGIALTGTRRTA